MNQATKHKKLAVAVGKQTFWAVIAYVVLSGSLSYAASISYSHTIAQQNVPFQENFTLQKFDTTLGTLGSITISLLANSTADVVVINLLPSAQVFTNATAQLPWKISAPAAISVSMTATAGPVNGTVPPGTFPVPGFSVTTFPGLPATISTSLSVPFINFGAYSGPGFALANFTAEAGNGTYGGTAPSGVAFTGAARMGGEVAINYTYASVPTAAAPEPTTLLYLAPLLIALGIWSKRRTAKLTKS